MYVVPLGSLHSIAHWIAWIRNTYDPCILHIYTISLYAYHVPTLVCMEQTMHIMAHTITSLIAYHTRVLLIQHLWASIDTTAPRCPDEELRRGTILWMTSRSRCYLACCAIQYASVSWWYLVAVFLWYYLEHPLWPTGCCGEPSECQSRARAQSMSWGLSTWVLIGWGYGFQLSV